MRGQKLVQNRSVVWKTMCFGKQFVGESLLVFFDPAANLQADKQWKRGHPHLQRTLSLRVVCALSCRRHTFLLPSSSYFLIEQTWRDNRDAKKEGETNRQHLWDHTYVWLMTTLAKLSLTGNGATRRALTVLQQIAEEKRLRRRSRKLPCTHIGVQAKNCTQMQRSRHNQVLDNNQLKLERRPV